MSDDESNSSENHRNAVRGRFMRILHVLQQVNGDNDNDDDDDRVSNHEDNDSSGSDDDNDGEVTEENGHDRYDELQRLVNFEDWEELGKCVDGGACSCHPYEWWFDMIRTLDYILQKQDLVEDFEAPKELCNNMIKTVVNMTNDGGQSVLEASYLVEEAGLETLKRVMAWICNRLDRKAFKRFLFEPTKPEKGLNTIDTCWKFTVLDLKKCGLVDTAFASPETSGSAHEKVSLALDRTYTMISMAETTSNCFLHSFLSAPCPNICVRAALEHYKRSIQEQDNNGNLPLHVAAANPLHHQLSCVPTRDDTPAIDMVLEKYPAAARIPNKEGRFALNLAIDNYGRWEAAQKKRTAIRKCPCCARSEVPLQDTIMKLVNAAPEALQARDTKTHMFPFMLAATTKSAPLSLIYNLLRENPGVVQCGVRKTHYEEYLENKLEQQAALQEADQVELESLKRERDELLERLGEGGQKRQRRNGLFGWLLTSR